MHASSHDRESGRGRWVSRGVAGGWLRRSVRAAGIAGWLAAGAVAVVFMLLALAVDGTGEVVSMGAGGAALGGLLVGPVLGGAVAGARSADSLRRRLDRAAAMGVMWGTLGALAVWGLARGFGHLDAGVAAVGAAGGVIGLGVGLACGVVVHRSRG